MKKNNIVENGEEVLIFSKYGFNTIPKMKGVIISSKESYDLSQHGSPWTQRVYNVVGDDKMVYFGTYGCASVWDYYFRTRQNFIYYLEGLIESNNKKIEELEEQNNEYKFLIENEEKQVKCLKYEKKWINWIKKTS